MTRISSVLLILAFLTFIAVLTIFPIEDPDIWHQIAYGRWLVGNNLQITNNQPFVWPEIQASETNFEWSSQVGSFLLFKNFGINSIIVLNSALILAAFFLLLLTSLYLGVPLIYGLPVLVLGVLTSSERFITRLEHFGNLWLVIEIGLIYWYKTLTGTKKKTKKHKILFTFAFLVLFLFWVHSHASFILGLFVLISFTVYSLISRQKNSRHLVLVAFLCSFLVLTHPNKADVAKSALAFIPFTPQKPLVVQKTYEFLPTFSDFHKDQIYVFFFKLLFAVYWGLWGIGLFKGKSDFIGFVMLSAGSYLGFSSARHINLFTIMGFLPAVGTLYTRNNTNLNTKHHDPKPLRVSLLPIRVYSRMKGMGVTGLAGILFSIGLLVVSVYIIRNGYSLGTTYRRFGFGIKPILPTGAVEFLDNNKIYGNLLNQMEIGPYIEFCCFPTRKVFIDGFGYYPEWFFKEYLSMSGSPEKAAEILDKYKIDYVLTLYPENSSGKSVSDYLSQSSQWALVYWDNYYLLFLRRQEKYADVVEKSAYRYADPLKLGREEFVGRLQREEGALLRPKIIEELEKNLYQNPQNARGHLLLGSMLEGSGDFDGALKEYVQAIRFDPDNVLPNLLISGILVKRQEFEAAREVLTETLAKNPNLPSAYLVLGQIEEKDKHFKEAEKYYKEALNFESGLALANLRLGIIYAYNLYDSSLARKNLLRALEMGLSDDQAKLAREALSSL